MNFLLLSALFLFVLGIVADNPHHAIAPYHLAFIADFLDARSDLHGFPLFANTQLNTIYTKITIGSST
jgi:hypothetical protein